VVTVERTYPSGTRCGTTRMSVSERYRFGSRQAYANAAAANTIVGRMISHLRRHAARRMSSGV
jgi:hypothetical protein